MSTSQTGATAIETALSVLGDDSLWLKFGHGRFVLLRRDGDRWVLHSTKLEISKEEAKAKGYSEDIRSRSRSISFEGRTDGLAHLLSISCNQDGGVFWVPAGAGADLPLKEAITHSDHIGCEIDGAPRDEQLRRYQWFSQVSGLAYGLQLSSGSKSIHSHIFLNDPVAIDELVRLRRLFVLCLLGDPAVTRPHQPMRFPGFFRREKGNYQELLSSNTARYSQVEIEQGLQAAFVDLGWVFPATLSDELWADLQRKLKADLPDDEKRQAIAALLTRGDEWYQQQARERAERQQAQRIRFAQQQLDGKFSLFDAVSQVEQRLSADESFNAPIHNWEFSGSNHARGMCSWHQSTSNSAWLSQVDGKWVYHCPTCTDDKPVSSFQYWIFNQRGGVVSMPTGKDWAVLAKDWLGLHGVSVPERQQRTKATKQKLKSKGNSAINEVKKLDKKAAVDPTVQAKVAHFEKMHQAASTLSLEPDVVIHDRYFPKGELPEPGGLLLIDGPMGTGKTANQLKGITEEHKARFPLAKILSLVSRNVLGRQQATDLELVHQESIEGNHQSSSSWVGCPNSMYRIRPKDIPAGSLLLLDEIEALIRYLLGSSTLKDDRILIIERFREWLRHFLRSGGFIVGCEDGITDLAINFIKDLVGFEFPIRFIKSEWKDPDPYPVTIFDSSSAWVEALPRKNIVVASDSINQVRELTEIYSSENTLIASSDSSHTDEIREFADDPNGYLRQQTHLKNLIYSPTIGEGVSITEPRYEVRGGYFTHLAPRDAKQMLNRYRLSVPTSLYVKPCGTGVNPNDWGAFDPQILIERFYENAEAAKVLTGFADYLKARDESLMSKLTELTQRQNADVNLWLSYYAKFEARDNWYRRDLRNNLVAFLESRGHAVTLIDSKASPGYSDYRKEIRQEIDWRESNKFAATIVPDTMDKSNAFEVLRTLGSTPDERTQARKCILQDELKRCDLDDRDFVYKAVVKDRGRFLSRTRTLWRALNVDAAKAYDRWTLMNATAKARMRGEGVWLPDIRLHSVQSDCLSKSPLFEVLRAVKDGIYETGDSVLKPLSDWAQQNAKMVFKKLRLTVKPDQTPLDIFNRFIRKLGYIPQCVSRKGKRGARNRQYQITNFYDSEREAILQSLTEKFEAKLEHLREAPDGSLRQFEQDTQESSDSADLEIAMAGKETSVEPICEQLRLGDKPAVEDESLLMTRLAWCQSAAEYQQIRQQLEAVNPDFETAYWANLPAAAQARICSYFKEVA
ncbi:MAG: hypothetical protein AAFV46_00725 [Cyanobacteria bacterium J06635_11]